MVGSGTVGSFALSGLAGSAKMDNPATLTSCGYPTAVSTLPGAAKSAAEGLRFPNAVTAPRF